MTYIYTAEIIAELNTLADEARVLDTEWRAVMADVANAIDAALPFGRYPGWELYETQLQHFMDVIHQEFQLPNLTLLPTVAGHFAYKNVQRPAEWRKLNNRCRREIAKARKALAQ